MADSFEERFARAREEEEARRRALEEGAAIGAQLEASEKAAARELVDEVQRAARVLAASQIPPAILEKARRLPPDRRDQVKVHSLEYRKLDCVFEPRAFSRRKFVRFEGHAGSGTVYISATGDVSFLQPAQKLSLMEQVEQGIAKTRMLSDTLDVIAATLAEWDP